MLLVLSEEHKEHLGFLPQVESSGRSTSRACRARPFCLAWLRGPRALPRPLTCIPRRKMEKRLMGYIIVLCWGARHYTSLCLFIWECSAWSIVIFRTATLRAPWIRLLCWKHPWGHASREVWLPSQFKRVLSALPAKMFVANKNVCPIKIARLPLLL